MELLRALLEVVIGSEESSLVGVLDVGLIQRVLVIVLLGILWAPPFEGNQLITEQFFAVDCHEESVSRIGDTSSIVGFSDQIRDGLPWNSHIRFIVRVLYTVLKATHVDG